MTSRMKTVAEPFNTAVIGGIVESFKRRDLKDFIPYFWDFLEGCTKQYISVRYTAQLLQEEYPELEIFNMDPRVAKSLVTKCLLISGWKMFSGNTKSGKNFARGKITKEQAKCLRKWYGKEIPKIIVEN